MAKVTGGEILAKALKIEGVDTIFNLPGDPMGPIASATKPAGMKTYSFRHEQATALAAQAYAYATKKVGVGIVPSGPAMTNAITGLMTAWSGCLPLLLIGGNGDRARRFQGDFQEAPQVETAAPFCKWTASIEDPRHVPYYVNQAVRKIMHGRPGPVYLDMPANVIAGSVDEEQVKYFPAVEAAPRPMADPQSVKRAVEAISKAQRPLLLIGKGMAWSEAQDEIRQFVDRMQIPFVPSPMGKGVVPDDHALNAQGARTYALQNADLVILAGARSNWIFHFLSAPRFSPDVKVVQLDIDPSEIGNGHGVDVGLVGDGKAVFGQMLEEIGRVRRPIETPWLQALETEKEKNSDSIAPMVNSNDAPMNMYAMYREMTKMMARDATVTADGENTMALSRVMVPNYLPRHRIDAGESGCMGVSTPYAIGMQVARPGKQVFSFNGDYAFGWNGFEVETAARYNLPIIYVVANNVSVGGPGHAELGTRLESPEQPEGIHYDKVMEAFGGDGYFIERLDQVRPALEKALSAHKPSLLNVVIDKRQRRKEQAYTWMTSRTQRMQY
ncbi:MAG: hypothetical protein EXR47_02535 [Dehalococcoidia bacterium]|nr:hypothetical protein [Dehalococcoidia bacterium]